MHMEVIRGRLLSGENNPKKAVTQTNVDTNNDIDRSHLLSFRRLYSYLCLIG